jgi:hypothetical protein
MLRVLRGAALAAVNTALAVAAHVVGGGGPPDGALTLLLTLAVAAAGTALADRRRGLVAMLGAVAIAQVVLHLLLDSLGGLSGHHPAAVVAASGVAPSGVAMTVAHAAAVVVTAALLAGAESALFTVAGVLRRIVVWVLPLRPAVRPVVEPATPLPATAPLPMARHRLLHRVSPRRGPPLPA